MRLNEVVYTDAMPIEGYGPGFFRIGGEAHDAPLAVLPAGIKPWVGFDDTDALLGAAESIDFLLVGTGPEIAHIPGPFRAAFAERSKTKHICRLAEGHYGGFFGWPNFSARLAGDFMGMSPTGKVAEFRYQVRDNGAPIELQISMTKEPANLIGLYFCSSEGIIQSVKASFQ